MKKIMLLLILLLLSVFSGCGNNDDGLQIAIVTSLTGVDDRSFNQNIYEGIHAFLNVTQGHTVTHIYEPTGNTDAAVQTVRDIAGDFCVVVLPGFQFGDVAQAATDNPDTYFILIDTWPSCGREFDNVRALQFAEEESGFLAGVVASLKTQTGYVAFIGGMPFPALLNYQFGFESGVNYANANLPLELDVSVVNLPAFAGVEFDGTIVGSNYAGGFNSPDLGFVIANDLLNSNVDVMFVAAGGTSYGVYNAIRQHPTRTAYVIGIDTDQFEEHLPMAEWLQVTAVYKATGLSVQRSLASIVDGNFEGGNFTKRADTDSVGIVTAPGRHQLSTATINRVNELFGRIRDGLIQPASSAQRDTYNFVGLN